MSKKAIDSWRELAGIVCTYKPAASSSNYVGARLSSILRKDLNSLETSPPRKYLDISRSDGELTINVRPSYADDVLCSGPKYKKNHLDIRIPKPLSDLASGVLIVGINGGDLLNTILKKLSFTRCYHLKGILGQATANYYINEKVLAKAKYDKVRRIYLENILASYQTAAQRRVFEEYGVPLNSQEAYNFAVKGLYRPVWNGPPITYGLKIVEFEPPNFTVEMQCVNETEVYLLNFIHNLGLSLKCFATCTEIRCLRQGCFHIDHALVKNQWNLNEVIDNIKLCWKILEETYPKTIKYSSTVYTSNNAYHSREKENQKQIQSTDSSSM